MLFYFIYSLLDLFGFMRKGQPQTGHVRRLITTSERLLNNSDEVVLLITQGRLFFYHLRRCAVDDRGNVPYCSFLEG